MEPRDRRAPFLAWLGTISAELSEVVAERCGEGGCSEPPPETCDELKEIAPEEEVCIRRVAGADVEWSAHNVSFHAPGLALERLREQLGEPRVGFHDGGLVVYPDVPVKGWALHHHPIAGVIELRPFTPLRELAATLTSQLGKTPGDVDRRGRVWEDRLDELLWSDFAIQVHPVAGPVKGVVTCVSYASADERRRVMDALVVAWGSPEQVTEHGTEALRFGNRGVVVDDREADTVTTPVPGTDELQETTLSCLRIGVGELTEDEFWAG